MTGMTKVLATDEDKNAYLPPGTQSQMQEIMSKLPLEDMDANSQSARKTVSEMMQGRLPTMLQQPLPWLLSLIKNGLAQAGMAISALICIGIVSGIVLKTTMEKQGSIAMRLCVAITCALAALAMVLPCMQLAKTAIESTDKVTSGGVPILSGMLAAGGGIRSAVAAQTLLSVLGIVILKGAVSVFLPICGALAALGIAAGVSQMPQLEDAVKSLHTLVRWGMGALAMLYGLLLAVAVVPASAADGILVRTATYATDTFVPVVGGAATQAVEGALGSMHLMRSAVGGGGMSVLLLVCAAPVIRMGVTVLLLVAVAGLMQTLCDKGVGSMLRNLADCVANMAICVILPAAMSLMTLVILGNLRLGT